MSESLTHTTTPPSAVDEADIVRGLRRGDREAWTALYDQYSGRVWRYAARLIGSDASAAADIVQETFLAAARSARQFDAARGTLWAWLAGIAHHFVAAHWRREGRQSRCVAAVQAGGHAGGLRPGGDADPVQRLELSEQAEHVRQVLASLPADYALVLVAKYIDGTAPDELPNVCGGTHEAVRSRLARARKQFRETYERLATEQEKL